jgi:thioredoxin reductase
MAPESPADVVVIGDGVAGRTAGLFTARHGLDTVVLGTASPLLRRNAHLENYPGFPAGVNARLLLDLMRDQLEHAGASVVETEVIQLDQSATGFVATGRDGETVSARYVIAATKNEVGYLDGIEGVQILDRGKQFLETDERGRTGVDGLYAAGRLAQKPHQTVVCAGHGAEVAVTLLEDADEPFYHDWVAPEGYFTGRDREVPPGCEEIDAAERQRREEASLAVMRVAFADRHPDDPEQHPSVTED